MIRRGHEAGLNVVALACDMGNRSMLYEMGFGTQKDNIRFSIPHPADPSKKPYVVPDCVHVFKSLKEGFCTNKTIILSDEVVNEFKLPSNKVLLSHIQWLEEYQRGQDLKFVPKLTFKDIQTSHFSKMKFKSAHTLLSHQTASSLHYLASKNIAPEEFETTGWFIKIMNRWREIVTSRCRLHSLNIKRIEDYDKKIGHLKLVVKVFKSMKFGAGWKPVQTHLILATEALIASQFSMIF
ncbi:Transposable element P transposase [Frankliniella fusca]|uniref:Transposable element P transposase n=1 Tax=Frankliniella fusca TaxID=407009 RepID=A0AAE1H9P9_9NEOP|nr:Transposable element P transposase [Frankliniella fusca]